MTYVGAMFVFFAVVIVTTATMPKDKAAEAQFPTGVFLTMPLLWLVMMGGFAITMTLGIIYCLKATRGEWAGYPIIGRLVARIAGF